VAYLKRNFGANPDEGYKTSQFNPSRFGVWLAKRIAQFSPQVESHYR